MKNAPKNNSNDNGVQQFTTPYTTQYNKHTKYLKPLLFLDVDEVILDSHKALVSILNNTFELNGTSDELIPLFITEWNFDTILTMLNNRITDNPELANTLQSEGHTLPLTMDYITHLFETVEFWDEVTFKEGALTLLEHLKDKYHIYFITKGTENNIWQKAQWLKSVLPNLDTTFTEQDYIVVPVKLKQSKNDVIADIMVRYIIDLVCQGVKVHTIFNALQLIQVDDNYWNLGTTCNLHILLKERETNYNQVEDIREDLYIAHNLNELEQILEFYSMYNYDDLKEINPKRKSFVDKIKNIINNIKGE